MIKTEICLVGPLPPPYGGISEHILRICSALNEFSFEIIDLHISKSPKINLDNVQYKNYKYNSKFYKIIWLSISLWSVRSRIKHFHFSLPKSLLFLFLSYKRKSDIWILTLHNGDLSIGKIYKNYFVRKLILWQLKRFDKIIAISSIQKIFYIDSQINEKKIITLSTYLPNISNHNNLENNIDFLNFKNSNKLLVATSGYPEKFYNFDKLIEFAKNHNYDGVGYIMAVYGDGDWSWISELEMIISRYSLNFIIFKNLNSNEFSRILCECDIYVRPTTMDSFGIALADAVNYGCIAIASNVCERYAGCRLYPVNDINSFYSELNRAIIEILDDGQIGQNIKNLHNEAEAYRKLYESAKK